MIRSMGDIVLYGLKLMMKTKSSNLTPTLHHNYITPSDTNYAENHPNTQAVFPPVKFKPTKFYDILLLFYLKDTLSFGT